MYGKPCLRAARKSKSGERVRPGVGVFRVEFGQRQTTDALIGAISSNAKRRQGFFVKVPLIGFTTTYKTAGTAKVRGSSYKTYFLWVGLWVGKSRRTPEPPHVFPRTCLDSFLNSRHPGALRLVTLARFPVRIA
jgi:hypothetical protein